jgi:E3 ubiquitin-protein ligase SIAH1
MVEHVIESIKVACSNGSHRCTSRITYYQKEDHEKGCQHAPCFCPEAGCSYSGQTKKLLDHFSSKHMWQCYRVTYKMFGIRLQVGSTVLMGEDGHLFLVNMVMEPLGGVVSVCCVQPHIAGSKFKCRLTLSLTEPSYAQGTDFLVRSTNLHDGLPKDCIPLVVPKMLLGDTHARGTTKVGMVLGVVLTPP